MAAEWLESVCVTFHLPSEIRTECIYRFRVHTNRLAGSFLFSIVCHNTGYIRYPRWCSVHRVVCVTHNCLSVSRLIGLDSVVLELGIFASQGIWLLRTYELRKQAKLDGKKFDDLPEARKYQYDPNGNAPTSASRNDIETGDVESGDVESCNIESEGVQVAENLSKESDAFHQFPETPSQETTETKLEDFKA